MQRSILSLPAAALLCSLSASSFAALTGLWNFNGDLNADGVGSAASFVGTAGSKSSFDTTTNFGIAALTGGTATVMHYTPYDPSEALAVPANIAANGGGARVNEYTIVMDYMPTTYTSGYLALLEANVNNNDSDAEVFLKETSHDIGCGYALGGYRTSPITDNAWYRIAIVVNVAIGRAEIFVDGTSVGAYNGGTLTTLDGNTSISAGAGSSFLLFTTPAAGPWSGAGYINSLAVYDHALAETQIATLGGPTAAGIPATEPAVPTGLVHESLFDKTTGTNPIYYGDVTRIHANDGDWTPGGSGWYTYPGDGTLKFWHPADEWDDSMFEYNSYVAGVPVGSEVEYEFDFDTNFLTTTGTNGTVEILMTAPGQSYADAKTNAEAILWFQTDMANSGAMSIGFGPGNADPALTSIPVASASMNTAKVIINHNPGTSQWRAFYSVNGGSLFEAPNSPLAGARTTTAIRVECDNTPWAATMDSWELLAQNLKVYSAIQTTAAAINVGEVLKAADFNEAAGAVGTNGFYYPQTADGLSDMYIPSPATQEYDGLGAWVIGYPAATTALYPNAMFQTVTTAADPVEFVLDINPQFDAAGQYQMFNFKVDGADAAMYVANDTGGSGGIGVIFGTTSIFTPPPGNVATLANTATTLTDLRLIMNYNPATTEYNAFYQENGGAVVPHPANPLVKARTDGKVEFQWQCWNTGGSTAFAVGLDNYEEQYGISTVDTTSVKDFMLFE